VDWKDKQVLVTGAAGFIGRHLTAQLVELGAQVSAFVRYNSEGGRREFKTRDGKQAPVRVISGDIKDYHAVYRAVANQDVVLHLAALIGIPYSYVHPYDYVQTNIAGTTHLLNACRAHATPRLMVTSTSEVYGTARYVPIDEEHPLQAQSPYAATKIAADQLALSYHCAFELPVALVRPFNTFGPGQSMRAVIPTIIAQALRGDVVRLGALSPRRDLTFVEDTAEGMIAVAGSDACIGQVVNLGASKDISIGDLAQRIFHILGREPRIASDDQRIRPEKSEVRQLLAGTARAQALFGWQPRHTLDQGLEKTIAFQRDRVDTADVAEYRV
jgi:NAD dependent epimerase/dehydratase